MKYQLFKWRKETPNKLEKGHRQYIYISEHDLPLLWPPKDKKNKKEITQNWLPYVICGGKLHKQRAYLQNNYTQA
jgi:hypothetical protein